MPEVRLHRADDQRRVLIATRTVHRAECAQLDRIAKCGAGAVRLDKLHIRCSQASLFERTPDHRFLRRTTGRRQACTRTILVHSRPADDREDAIAVALRVTQSLQHHHAAALATDEAVGSGIERLAPAIRREHVRACKSDE